MTKATKRAAGRDERQAANDDLSTKLRHKARQQGALVVGTGVVWGVLVVALFFSGGLGALWEGWRNWEGGILKPVWFAVLGAFSIGWLIAVPKGLYQLATGRVSADDQEEFIESIESDAQFAERRSGSVTLAGHRAAVAACAFSADGRQLVSSGRDGTLRLWNVETAEVVATFKGARMPRSAAFALAADGTLLADVRDDNSARVLDLTSGEERTIPETGKRVNSCAFSPEGALLAVADSDGRVVLWDRATDTTTPLGAHAKGITACAFSPDGSLLATASADKTVKVWDVATRTEVRSLARHKHAVKWCSFSPDGSVLVSLGSDGFFVWSGDELLSTMSLGANAWIVREFAFSVDGHDLVYTAAGEVIFRAVAIAGSDPRTFAKVKKPILCCAVSPDGRHLATAGEDKKITIWQL